MLTRRSALLGGLASSLATQRPASAYQPRGHPAAPGDTIFFGPQQPWSGVGANFATHGALRVNSSGRYIEHADGTYFPWVGDTAWELMTNTTLAEATVYLENRRAKGFSMVQVILNGLYFTTNRAGDTAFPGGNLSAPGSAFFGFVDSVVSVAATKGIGLLLFPIWGQNYGGATPLIPITSFSQAQATSFGNFIAGRYASSPHVIYGIGGDISPADGKYIPMGAQMKQAAPSALITCHPNTISTDVQGNSWIDFSAAQSSHFSQDNTLAYSYITTCWNASPTKPTINLESAYENTAINFNPANGYFTPFDVRQQMWWSLCAGGFGTTFGNYGVTDFMRVGQAFAVANPPLVPNWINCLGGPVQPAGNQVRHIRSMLQARPGLRTPDQTLVTNALSGGNTLLCCRGSNFAWIYTGYGDSFTVNMGKISGASVRAYWFNARTGLVIYINTYVNTGTQIFTAPGGPSRGNDWVLLLDDASVAFPIPGVAFSAA